jgi:hypothetical protein
MMQDNFSPTAEKICERRNISLDASVLLNEDQLDSTVEQGESNCIVGLKKTRIEMESIAGAFWSVWLGPAQA